VTSRFPHVARMISRMRRHVPTTTILIVAVGCGGGDQHHTTSLPPNPNANAGAQCAHDPPTFQESRFGEVRKSFVHVLKSDLKMIPFPSKDVHDRCYEVDELVRPFCFEGAASRLGYQIVDTIKAGKDFQPAVADIEQKFVAADDRWNMIHCRGFGNGMSELALDRQAAVLAKVSPRCAQHAVDGMAASWGWDNTQPLTGCETYDSPTCQAGIAEFYAETEKKCAARPEYAEFCMYGFGRMIGNYFAGRFEEAVRTCRGTYRTACLAGVGFVSVYLYPDKIERSLQAAATLPAADQGGYFEGVANGLSWRKKSDPAKIDTWLARLSPSARGLTDQILAAAASCGLSDFHSGKECKWPTAPQTCIR